MEPNVREGSLTDSDRARIARTQMTLRETSTWLDAHYEELQESHAEQWVAFTATGLVSAATHYHDLLSQLDREQLARGEVYTEYILPNPRLQPATTAADTPP